MNYLVQAGFEPTRNNNKVIRIYTCRYARLAYILKSERERGHTSNMCCESRLSEITSLLFPT